MIPRVLGLLLVATLAQASDPNGVQLPPKPVTAGGKAIDTERSGHASPFLVDWSGKGTPDLILAEHYQGRIWQYKNDGKPGAAKFQPREPVLASGVQAAIATRCGSGAHPALADVAGTGKMDLIASAMQGDFWFFRNTGDDTFAEAERIRDDKGKLLDIGSGVSPFLYDWDATGQVGILAGNSRGEVYFCPRIKGEAVRFGPARPLRLGDGKPLVVASGCATPIVADWDGDGVADILSGAYDGSVVWYRNAGTRKEPKLEAARQLVPPSPGRRWENLRPGEWGQSTRPAVVDWHGTGRLDLIVGDMSGYYFGKPTQTPEEQGEENRANAALPKVRAAWSAALQEYRAAQVEPVGETAAQKGERAERVAALRIRVTLLRKAIADAQDTQEKYRETTQHRGQVWLFERNPPAEKK